MDTPVDLLVERTDSARLHSTLQQLPGCVAVVSDEPYEGNTVVRVYSGLGFVKFAFETQGYAKVIRQLDELI